jgi:Uma2 family endonuclease
MRATLAHTEERPLRPRLSPLLNMTDDQLYELCQLDPELQIEQSAQGGLLIMLPTGGEMSKRNLDLILAVCTWAKHEGSAIAFDSSGGFLLPNEALRSPGVARPPMAASTRWPASPAGGPRLEGRGTNPRHHFRDICSW